MRKSLVCLLLVVAFLTLQAGQPLQKSGVPKCLIQRPSSIYLYKDAKGVVHRKTVNSKLRYESIALGDNSNPQEVLFVETVENEPVVDGEGLKSKVTIEARRCTSEDCKDLAWTICDSSDACEYFRSESGSSLYKLVKYGCCGGENTTTLYDTKDAKQILTCSEDGFAISGDRREFRVAATYLSANGYYGRHFNTEKGEMGLVSLYAKDALVSQALVVSGGLDPWTPQMTLLSDKIVLKYSEGAEVVVSFAEGYLDCEHIQSKVPVKLIPVMKEQK